MSDTNGAPYPGRGTPGKEIKPEETKGFKLLGHCDFGGENKGDIMQALLKDNFLFFVIQFFTNYREDFRA